MTSLILKTIIIRVLCVIFKINQFIKFSIGNRFPVYLLFKKKNNKLILKRKHKVDADDFLPLEKIGNNIIENFSTSQLIFMKIYDEYYKENK